MANLSTLIDKFLNRAVLSDPEKADLRASIGAAAADDIPTVDTAALEAIAAADPAGFKAVLISLGVIINE